MAIWQDLVTDHGFSGAYNTVKRFVGKLRGSKQPEAVGIIGPGKEAQVDYGTGSMMRVIRRRASTAGTAVRDDAGLQAAKRFACGVPFQYTHMGRAA